MHTNTVSYKIFSVINHIFMAFICVIILYPYLNVLAVALNDNASTITSGLTLWPQKFTLANFETMFSDPQIWRATQITLMRIFFGVPLGLMIVFFGSYALSKNYLPGRRVMVFLLLIPMYISAGLIPTFILYSEIGLLNSFWVYVLPVGFNFFFFVLLRTYMYSIPQSLEESAKIDGANDITIMFRIYLPLCTPILATLILFSTISHWNDWVTTLYFVRDINLSTLAFELQRVLREQDRIVRLIQEAIMQGMLPPTQTVGTSSGLRNAQIIITTLPIIMIYPFLQKYFIHGMMVGSIKE